MDRFLFKLPPKTTETNSRDVTTSSCDNINLEVSKSKPCTSTSPSSPIALSDFVQSETKTSKTKRNYLVHWSKTYKWITYKNGKVYCKICTTAVNMKLPLPTETIGDKKSAASFVKNGFCTWNKAIERFKSHESSNFHRLAVMGTTSLNQGTNVVAHISAAKKKDMQDARMSLLKIFSSIQYLAVQGMPLRGHIDKNSNFLQLVKLRAADCPELKTWLGRTKYQWLSHDIINEILEIMGNSVLRELIAFIKKCDYYSIMADETSDISTKEQMSICLRSVDEDLNIHELFLGFYEATFTNSDRLFTIIKDVLVRFSLPIEKCRGQCYDGAANMSGHLSGVQARLLAEEPRAIYVHCSAHSLNLVVQDTMKNIVQVRDILTMYRELIVFVRSSPKRLAIFKTLQDQPNMNGSLRPFCPTRWCLRIKSLQSIYSNYETILMFLKEIHESERNDSGSKANGFLTKLMEHESVLLLKMIITVLERVEILNAELQKSLNLYLTENKIKHIIEALAAIRNSGFESIWNESKAIAEKLDLDEAKLPRARKIPRRFDEGSIQHQFLTPEDKYRQIYLELVDYTLNSLKERFKSNVQKVLCEIEQFAIGKGDQDIFALKLFYRSDFDFDRLILHRNIFLDVAKRDNIVINSFNDILLFFKNENSGRQALKEIVSEYIKFIRIVLTIPVSSCTAERSFSGLRRLKTYLRSNMIQERLNNLAVLNIHKEAAQNLNLDIMVDDFIKRTSIRCNTFQVGKM